jgi:hypothetical protein
MGGDTRGANWDVDTLKEHYDEHLRLLMVILDERARAQDSAITKAEEATKLRFESVNEFRAALTDQTATFVTRDQFEGLVEIVAGTTRRLDLMEGRSLGANRMWVYLLGAIATLATVLSIVLAFSGKGL